KLEPDGPQFVPCHEVAVGEGKAVGRCAGLWRIGNPICGRDILDRIAERVASGFVLHVSRLAIAWVWVQPYRVGTPVTNRKGNSPCRTPPWKPPSKPHGRLVMGSAPQQRARSAMPSRPRCPRWTTAACGLRKSGATTGM